MKTKGGRKANFEEESDWTKQNTTLGQNFVAYLPLSMAIFASEKFFGIISKNVMIHTEKSKSEDPRLYSSGQHTNKKKNTRNSCNRWKADTGKSSNVER